MNEPTSTVIGGANGCGKSSMTRWAKAFFQQLALVDSDAIAVDLKVRTQAISSDLEAGKAVSRSAGRYLGQGVSFSVETTLSGKTYLLMVEDACNRGLRTRPIHIGTDSVAINMARVRARVLKGGHDVPVTDQLRRYPRSFKNLRTAMELADECVLLDNSTDAGHRIVGLKLHGTEPLAIVPLPSWAEFLRP